jgi:hypothetical protein
MSVHDKIQKELKPLHKEIKAANTVLEVLVERLKYKEAVLADEYKQEWIEEQVKAFEQKFIDFRGRTDTAIEYSGMFLRFVPDLINRLQNIYTTVSCQELLQGYGRTVTTITVRKW